MARISGVDIPIQKRVVIALTYIYGIGPSTSKKLLKSAKVDENTRVKDLTEAEIAAIRKAIDEEQIPVEGELKRIVSQNVKRLIDIKSYRGFRHRKGLPVRGQKTKSNFRKSKGKGFGVVKSKLKSKKK